jgi:hypothetical protein
MKLKSGKFGGGKLPTPTPMGVYTNYYKQMKGTSLLPTTHTLYLLRSQEYGLAFFLNKRTSNSERLETLAL